MALKPPPIGDVFQQINKLVANNPIKDEIDKSLHSAVRSALTKLDVVTREEFDTQAEVLLRTRGQVLALEAELKELTRELEALASPK